MTIHEKIYNYYISIQSQEMREDIVSWKPLKMKGVKAAIRIDFKKDWIKVYQLQSGEVNWC